MAHKTSHPDISIIVPMHNESSAIDIFFTELMAVLSKIKESWEVICINDNSSDDTLDKLKKYNKKDSRIKIIAFSRNFGKEAGLTAGMDYASGRAVIPMDADLQDPPELIHEMIEKWKEGYKVVIATRKSRRGDGWLKHVTASMFYNIIGHLSLVRIPKNTGDFRLMDRAVVDVVKSLPERTRFMKGLFAWVGFPTVQIYFKRPKRKRGQTSWNYWRLWQFALDGIFSFSTLPLKIWTYIGSLIAFFSLIYAIFLIGRTLIIGVDVPGYASIMTAVLFMGGIQLISIGIIGEYIARIYRETKQRPIYVSQEIIGFSDDR